MGVRRPMGRCGVLLAVVLLGVSLAVPASAAAVDPTPTVRWTFDEGTGTAAADSVGDVDGVLQAGAAWQTTNVAVGAAALDARDGSMLVANAAALEPADPTVSAWIRSYGTTAPDVGDVILEKGAFGCAGPSYGLYATATGLELPLALSGQRDRDPRLDQRPADRRGRRRSLGRGVAPGRLHHPDGEFRPIGQHRRPHPDALQRLVGGSDDCRRLFRGNQLEPPDWRPGRARMWRWDLQRRDRRRPYVVQLGCDLRPRLTDATRPDDGDARPGRPADRRDLVPCDRDHDGRTVGFALSFEFLDPVTLVSQGAGAGTFSQGVYSMDGFPPPVGDWILRAFFPGYPPYQPSEDTQLVTVQPAASTTTLSSSRIRSFRWSAPRSLPTSRRPRSSPIRPRAGRSSSSSRRGRAR